MSWRHQAACSRADPELFFGQPEEVRRIAKAKAVCSGCPVQNDCLIYALEKPELYGVWGGMTGEERRLLQVRTRLAATPRQ